MMVEFYAVGLNRIKDWTLIDRPNNYLLSASHCWVPGKKQFRLAVSDMRDREAVDCFFLDSGGFQLFNKYGRYPFSCQELVRFASSIGVDCLAAMDYPTEGSDHRIRAKAGLSNKQRIQLSVENAIQMQDLLEDIPSKIRFYPVLQGYTVGEYVRCADLLKEVGLGEDYLAVGSVCVRKRIQEIRRILSTARREFPRARIHVFGLSVKTLRYPDVVQSIDSLDSLAWSSKSTKGYMYFWDEFAEKLRTVGLARVDLKKRQYQIQEKDGSIRERELTVLDKIQRYHIPSQSAFLISLRSYKQNIAFWTQRWEKRGPSLTSFF